MNAPCKDCKDRKLGCHDACDNYKAWKDYNATIKKAKNETAEVDMLLKAQGERRHKNHSRKRNQYGTN